MSEAVIVDAVRTPVGRAFMGSLASLRPDETLAFIVDALLERNPGVDPGSIEELIAGVGLPQGLQANNVARLAVLLSEKLPQTVNGSVVARYCSSGLDAIRIAANHIVAGQGDAYLAGGVEFVSRYNAAQEVYAEHNKSNPMFKKLHDSLIPFRNDSFAWQQVAELGFDSFMMRMRTRT